MPFLCRLFFQLVVFPNHMENCKSRPISSLKTQAGTGLRDTVWYTHSQGTAWLLPKTQSSGRGQFNYQEELLQP